MKVKEILRNCAILLDDSTLASKVNTGVFNTQENQVIQLLLDCIQLTNIRIASEHIYLKDLASVNVLNDEINLTDITTKKIFDIVSIKRDGYPVQFSIRGGKVYTKSGKLDIEYTYLPESHDINSEITYYPCRINERVFAYGVVSEYLAIKGNIDDSAMWEDKFLRSISQLYAKHKEIIMPKRRWR